VQGQHLWRILRDGLRSRQTLRMLLQPLDPEEFLPDR